ncbi:MAG: glycosyltransferase [Terriglobia bacterium]
MEERTIRPGIFMMTNTFETGGSERQFAVLAGALRQAEFRVDIGCLGDVGPLRDRLGEVKEFPAGGSLYCFQSLLSRMALGQHLRAQQIAIAQAFDFYSNLMLIPTARLARVPVVIGSHRQLGDLLGPARFTSQGLAFRLCDRVVCNSRAAANRLVEQGVSERKIVVIPNGLPEEAFNETLPVLPKSDGILRVGMIARMNNPVKNYPGFLHAAARLVPRFSKVEFLLVGDGPLRPDLEKLAKKLGLERQARFLGDRTDVPAVLASMDISVLTSFSESLSNAVMESMAAGLPVVATRVGGNVDLVREGETGFLVPVNDEISLANALERLLLDPAMRLRLGGHAKQVMRSTFSLRTVREQYENLYSDLLARKRWKSSPRVTVPEQVNLHPKLRVAIVGPSLRYVGGQAVQADLLRRQWRDDPDVEAWFVPVDPPFPRWLPVIGAIPLVRTLARTPFYLSRLWRGIKDADIVHIFSASYWSFLLAPFPALVVAKLRGKKALINYHSGEARDHLSHWKTALPILRAADRRVVPSAYLVDVFRQFGLGAVAVPNTVDLDQFQYRPRRPLRPLFVCTRGFGAYYSVDLVVRAFARVREEYPAAQLCLLGSGGQERQVRAVARALGVEGVHFAGAIPHEKIGPYYDQADIFMNASWLDNMPVSILEAFASGTPVVTTAPEGIRYIVEHERTGLLSPPGDWRSLAENALRLLRQPDWALRLAENAREQSQKYCWAVVRQQWLALYRDVKQASSSKAGISGGSAPA